jgi:hypothetical protein
MLVKSMLVASKPDPVGNRRNVSNFLFSKRVNDVDNPVSKTVVRIVKL